MMDNRGPHERRLAAALRAWGLGDGGAAPHVGRPHWNGPVVAPAPARSASPRAERHAEGGAGAGEARANLFKGHFGTRTVQDVCDEEFRECLFQQIGPLALEVFRLLLRHRR